MAPVVEFARPKVNLTLRVWGKRADGFHDLESLVAFADGVADTVSFSAEGTPGVLTSGPSAAAIQGENLLSLTLRRMAEVEPRLRLGAVRLEKNLPVASGIGGGSADAAALMRAVLRAHPQFAELHDWRAVALRIGADVPVAFDNRAAMMRGVGEIVQPVAAMARLPALLVNPMVAVPADKTARVFRALGAGPVEPGARSPAAAALAFSDSAALLAWMTERGNDLSAPALSVVPAIGEVLAALEGQDGCRLARLSGAGPTCFGIFASQAVAQAAGARLAARQPGWWIAPVVLG